MADPVVERIPIYLSQEFAQTLHLVKLPLREPNRPYNDLGPLQSATFKPNHNILSLQHQLDKNSAHYNHSAENQIDSFTLQTQVTPKRANYVIAQRTEDAMILHPLRAIHSLLPVFSHVDTMQQEYDNDLLPQQEDEETAMKQVQLKVKRAEKVGGVKRVTHDTLVQSIQAERPQNCTWVNTYSKNLLQGNAEIPQVGKEIEAKWAAQSGGNLKANSMGDDDVDDIDCSKEVKLELLQQKAQREFQQRQDELLASEPLYSKGGDDNEPQFTSQPYQLRQAKEQQNQTSKQQQKRGQSTEKSTPLAQFVAPFATHSPSSSAVDPADARNTISLSSQRGNTTLTGEQILQFLIFSRVVTFKAIAQNLNVNDPTQFRTLLLMLQKHCLIVHGNFVLRSQYVYNHDGSNANPLNKQQLHIRNQTIRLSLARTYILHAFAKVPVPADLLASFQEEQAKKTTSSTPLTQHPLLSWRPSISQKVMALTLEMSPKELIPILQELAVQRPLPPAPLYDKFIVMPEETLWDFKLPVDYFFLKTFPQVAEASAEQLKQIITAYYPAAVQ